LKLTNLYQEQVDLEEKLETAKQIEENAAKNNQQKEKDVDEVDLYIRQLKQGEKLNIKVKWQWRKRLLEIENEERQFAKLLKICKPKEFDISTWRQRIREEAKLNLTTKQKPISRPSPPPIQKESMPPPSSVPKPVQPASQEAEIAVDPASTKPKPTIRRKPARSSTNSKDQYDDADHYSEDKFAGWMPPENEQTGDGRTALNDKYGY
jgi:hypothetical protein